MADEPSLPIAGQVHTTAMVNVRQGAASTNAPVLRKVGPGLTLTVYAVVVGEAVQGNPHWYQVDSDAYIWSGGCGPFTVGARAAGAPVTPPGTQNNLPSNFAGPGTPLSQTGLDAALGTLGVRVEALWAVLAVETSGWGFLPDRRPQILFERHKFHRLTGGHWDADDPDISAPTQGGYGAGGPHQYLRLEAAIQLDQTAALMSASWGLGQIMGENFKTAGFGSVQGMVAAFVAGEDAQLAGMANFVRNSDMAAALQAQDWATFARRYNGSNYAQNHYDEHLAMHYSQYRKAGLPDLQIRAAQIGLAYKGYQPGPPDGVAGEETTEAVRAFQAAASLPVSGVIDAVLIAALQT